MHCLACRKRNLHFQLWLLQHILMYTCRVFGFGGPILVMFIYMYIRAMFGPIVFVQFSLQFIVFFSKEQEHAPCSSRTCYSETLHHLLESHCYLPLLIFLSALVGAFNVEIGITGAILTKLDGDSRGGAALSIKEVSQLAKLCPFGVTIQIHSSV